MQFTKKSCIHLCIFFSLSDLDLKAFKPRHHPEHSACSGRGPWHSRTVLRPREDVLAEYPLLRWGQKRGAQSLPQYDSGLLRLQIVALLPSSPPIHLNLAFPRAPLKKKILKNRNWRQVNICSQRVIVFHRDSNACWTPLGVAFALGENYSSSSPLARGGPFLSTVLMDTLVLDVLVPGSRNGRHRLPCAGSAPKRQFHLPNSLALTTI